MRSLFSITLPVRAKVAALNSRHTEHPRSAGFAIPILSVWTALGAAGSSMRKSGHVRLRTRGGAESFTGMSCLRAANRCCSWMQPWWKLRADGDLR